MACAICEVRKPRRFCPGVRGDVCTICCGTEREVSVDCPLDCVYLQDAHTHERPPEVSEEAVPNRDIRVTDSFLYDHEPLLVAVGRGLFAAAMDMAAIDFDVREAIEALVKTYRTLESGVYYGTRPANPIADRIRALVQSAIAEFRTREREQTGLTQTRDADALGVLVFLQRLEFDRNNGRRRGRAFLDFLRQSFSPAGAQPPASSLIVP
ncbi:MAG: hypothetical protein ACE15B_09445 [Bryobacteraceae bacterium]